MKYTKWNFYYIPRIKKVWSDFIIPTLFFLLIIFGVALGGIADKQLLNI